VPHWVRVRDTKTKHQFDVEKRSLRPGLEPLDDPDRWPDLTGPMARPRPAKPHVGKDGKAVPAEQSVPDETSTDEATDSSPQSVAEPEPAAPSGRRSTRTPAQPLADTAIPKEQKP